MKNNRIESIDLLRGFVMIVMALDHVRLYLHFDSLVFNPTDLQRTTPALFATRLITHLCAPTFILLAGTSAYFIARRKTLKETSVFLLTRGTWLILLQMTLIRFGWNFDPAFHFNSSNIISTIGFSMVTLAGLIHFRLRTILIFGFLVVAGHNTLDAVSFQKGSVADATWSFLHQQNLFLLGDQYSFQFHYPLIPWIGVIALGYCLGQLYDENYTSTQRKKIILGIGLTCLFSFFLLRWVNVYGDPFPWTQQESSDLTIMSFFKVQKYPPSLLYLCLTLGVSFTLLGIMEGKRLERWRPVTLFGKVALFYYVLHIFVIHAFALVATVAMGYPWQASVFMGPPNLASPEMIGKFGFNLAYTYLIWIGVVILLYPLCRYWYSLKERNKSKWWVSYV